MGRKAFIATSAQREAVATGRHAGYSHGQIADLLGVSKTTLEKHFAFELRSGAARRRIELLTALFDAAKRGRVAAMKAFLRAGNKARRD